jgi:hypothetical protein
MAAHAQAYSYQPQAAAPYEPFAFVFQCTPKSTLCVSTLWHRIRVASVRPNG